jgi:hypothetical protein
MSWKFYNSLGQEITSVAGAASDWKNSVRVASTAPVTIAAPGASIDGVPLLSGERVLLKNQGGGASHIDNGIYVWNSAIVPMTRALDANDNVDITTGTTVYVEEGTANTRLSFTLVTTGSIIIGSTPLSFVQAIGGVSAQSNRRSWFGV